MPINGEKFQATVSYELEGGSQLQNVYHFLLYGSAGNTATDADLILAITNRLASLYMNFDTYVCDGISTPVVFIDEIQWEGTKWGIFRHVGASVLTGVVADAALDPLPAGCSALMTLYPLYAKHAGKKYFGGFDYFVLDTDGSYISGLVNALTTGSTLLLAGFPVTASPANLAAKYIILNRSLDVYNTPTSAVIDANPAYQRRRKLGRGS